MQRASLSGIHSQRRTDADAGKVLAVAQRRDDAAHAVVPAMAALCPQSRLCRRQVQVVVDHQHMVLLDLQLEAVASCREILAGQAMSAATILPSAGPNRRRSLAHGPAGPAVATECPFLKVQTARHMGAARSRKTPRALSNCTATGRVMMCPCKHVLFAICRSVATSSCSSPRACGWPCRCFHEEPCTIESITAAERLEKTDSAPSSNP